MITSPGHYDNVLEEHYHGRHITPEPCFSTGVCKDLINKSPLHAWTNHPALNDNYQEEQAEKFDIGHVAHALFLQGIDKAVVIKADDWRTKAAKEGRDNARSQGKIPLLADQYDRVCAMVSAAHSYLRESELGIVDLQKEGYSERTYVWKEGETWCKCRTDWIDEIETEVVDYKTTASSVNLASIRKLVLSNGYDIQEALYRRGVYAVTGRKPEFVFLFQETEPPYACSLISLPENWRKMGEEKVDTGLMIWRQCMSSGQWPAYPLSIQRLDLPAWAIDQWETARFASEITYQEEEL